MLYWGAEQTWLGGDIRYAHGSEGVEKPTAVLSADERADGDMHGRVLEKSARRGADGADLLLNPEGPDGNPDPIGCVRVISARRSTRMAMNDRRTVALIAGGPHVWQDARRRSRRPTWRKGAGKRPGLEEMGFGWKNSFRHRQGRRHHYQRP